MKTRHCYTLLLSIFIVSCLYAQKPVTRLPNDSTYKNKSSKTMWVLTNAALDTFTVNYIKNKSCQRIGDSLQIQVKLFQENEKICKQALDLRTKEALLWHVKLDSTDLKLQYTEINLEKEKKSKSNWVKATFGAGGAALVFLITTIIFAAK